MLVSVVGEESSQGLAESFINRRCSINWLIEGAIPVSQQVSPQRDDIKLIFKVSGKSRAFKTLVAFKISILSRVCLS